MLSAWGKTASMLRGSGSIKNLYRIRFRGLCVCMYIYECVRVYVVQLKQELKVPSPELPAETNVEVRDSWSQPQLSRVFPWGWYAEARLQVPCSHRYPRVVPSLQHPTCRPSFRHLLSYNNPLIPKRIS